MGPISEEARHMLLDAIDRELMQVTLTVPRSRADSDRLWTRHLELTQRRGEVERAPSRD